MAGAVERLAPLKFRQSASVLFKQVAIIVSVVANVGHTGLSSRDEG